MERCHTEVLSSLDNKGPATRNHVFDRDSVGMTDSRRWVSSEEFAEASEQISDGHFAVMLSETGLRRLSVNTIAWPLDLAKKIPTVTMDEAAELTKATPGDDEMRAVVVQTCLAFAAEIHRSRWSKGSWRSLISL